ncbi:MAG: ABC transporter permease [Treponema sp.]
MLEDFINAFAHFRNQKLRTVLSLLGIAIGVTVVIIISNMGSSLQVTMVKMFGLDSMTLITVYPRWNFDKQELDFELTDRYRDELQAAVPLVKNVFYVTFWRASLSRHTLSAPAQALTGIEYGWLEAHGYELAYGEGFRPDDFAQHRHKIIIGDDEAKQLFPDGNPIGQRITATVQYYTNGITQFIPFSFEVCGVVKPKNNVVAFSQGGTFYIPRSFIIEEMGGARDADEAQVEIYHADDIDAATQQIESFTDAFTQKPRSAWLFSQKSMLDELNTILVVVSAVLTAIAAVSLAVGGINIMNIMLVTVTERKKEIGIRKALGASEAVIRNQFLAESATLSLLGGTIGVMLGSSISLFLVENVFQHEEFQMVFAQNIPGTIAAFAVSITIGIFFGFHPAVKAARLDPVKALE